MGKIKICSAVFFAVFICFFVSAIYPLTRLAHADGRSGLKDAWQFYEKGNQFYEQGKYKEAQEEFQKALVLVSTQEKDNSAGAGKADTAKETASQDETMQMSQPLKYAISEGDTLQISVWEWDNLNQEVIVRPDGMISFPLIGDMQAAGLTVPQLDQKITEGLKEYIKHPQVSIIVKQLGGSKIIILGQVSGPGVYSVKGRKTILEAIALAGGFNKDAVLSSVILIRGGPDNPKGKRLNLNRAISKVDMSQNVTLETEDVVYVPKNFIANVNYFVSDILGPLVKGAESAQKISSGQFFRDSTSITATISP